MKEEIIGGQRLILGDAREIVSSLTDIDVTLTDPPYGIEGGRGGNARLYKKGKYEPENWADTRQYIQDVVVPIIDDCRRFERMALTPGCRCMYAYPEPDDIGCFYAPAAMGRGPWGFCNFSPILYYGRDFRAGIGSWPTSKQVTEASPKNGHPCPKPIKAWAWLLEKVALPTDTVLDPFMGSGTTLVVCENTGRHGTGIEIEPKFWDIARREVEKATKQQKIEFEQAVDTTLFEVAK